MINIIKFIIWIIQAASVPLILVLVWLFDIRPFSILFKQLDALLATDLAGKLKAKSIPPAIYGAIDVALLTFIYNVVIKVFSNFFKRPVSVSVEIKDRKSNKNFCVIPFKEEHIEVQTPNQLTVKGEIEIKYAKWLFDYLIKGIRIRIIWHPIWLSIEPQINRNKQFIVLNELPGEIYFNFMDMLSDSDRSTTIEGKLLILANSAFKQNGYVNIKVEINSDYKILRVGFNWIIRILVKADLKPCSISLEKEGS